MEKLTLRRKDNMITKRQHEKQRNIYINDTYMELFQIMVFAPFSLKAL